MKTSSSYLELLFENRNKEYGAYELRTHYHERLLKAFGYALLVASLLFLIPYLLTVLLTRQPKASTIDAGTVYTIQPEIIFEKEKAEPVASHPAARTLVENNYRVVRTIPEEKKPDAVTDKPETVTASTGTATGPENNLPANGTLADDKPVSNVPEVMEVSGVEVAPSFPGGETALMKYMAKNIHFAQDALADNIKGKVFVSFIVNELGAITNVKIMKSVDGRLDNAVVSAVVKMPKWSPGMYHGQAVKTAFILPVSFDIK